MSTTVLPKSLQYDAALLAEICERFHVRWIAVFGSVARGEQRPESDVDVLYEFVEGTRASLFTVVELSNALTSVFGNRFVDLGSASQLMEEVRATVLHEAVVLYER